MAPAAKSADSKLYFDGLFSFEKGMDSGVQPLLLPNNQAAMLTNSTVRTTFVQPRPPFNKISLNYNGSVPVQSGFEQGFWQGGCFYNPDTGNQCLMAAVSGRLFQFSLSGTTATVTEQTIPGDPNPASTTQSWLWQSENYVIWNDGKSLPVFYNGSKSVRSNGQTSQNIGTISADFTAPAIGSPVAVTLAAPYTGPFNVAVIVQDGAKGNVLYQPVNTGNTYFANITNLSDSPGGPIASGTQILSEPGVLGVVSQNFTIPQGLFAGSLLQFHTFVPVTAPIGSQFLMGGIIWTLKTTGDTAPFCFPSITIPQNIPISIGTVISFSSNNQPNVVVGTLASPSTVPNVGASVQVSLTSAYTGPDNAVVFIGSAQYTIIAVPTPPPGTALTLVNLTDVAGTTHTAVSVLTLFTVPQLPPGRMGVYGMGRNWMSLVDGKSYIASDIVGGASGTPANKGRDAVLNITENSYLAGGGVFQVPGSVGDIRAMIFTSTLDSSLGQGPLQILTPTTIFSCNAPVDRTTWSKLTNPIQTVSMIGNGGLGQNSTVAVNSDTFFRSVDGFRSLILAQRQFATWGNVPLSIEMDRILVNDNTALLNYGSSAVFDNRLLSTCSPQAGPQGVYHPGIIALNFDPERTIQQKADPVYDGLWEGLNVLQFITGLVAGVQRCFAFCYNPTLSKLELYEIMTDSGGDFDNGDVPIVWSGESSALFKQIKGSSGKGPFDLVRLIDGEIYVDQVKGKVDFQIWWRPDQYPCWVPWYSWEICAVKPNPLSLNPKLDPTYQPQYRQRMGFGKPDASLCDPVNNFSLAEGCVFQIKWQITGQCRLLGIKSMACELPDVQFSKPVGCTPQC